MTSEGKTPERRVLVQRGELPAETVTELVDALRQSISAAGTEASSAADAFAQGRPYEAEEIIERLRDRLQDADWKLAMALDKVLSRPAAPASELPVSAGRYDDATLDASRPQSWWRKMAGPPPPPPPELRSGVTSEGKTPEAERPVLEAGQVWRSLVLRDYSVRLIRPLHDDFWLVAPSGSSSHGKYVEREAALRDPQLFALDTATLSPPASDPAGGAASEVDP